ncbi:hypothetical protein CALCODRAFT_491050 [Calocera cornea HHB12733]|uniref:Uncharacterized protein n=1 Tax=Calocera cornea HHB12733 TaxID=1353952 RepID=A0A165J8S1_9BASI|nr:hypothetical protein CALCODRAFT_491050 [Calocera cornea HHB12733]
MDCLISNCQIMQQRHLYNNDVPPRAPRQRATRLPAHLRLADRDNGASASASPSFSRDIASSPGRNRQNGAPPRPPQIRALGLRAFADATALMTGAPGCEPGRSLRARMDWTGKVRVAPSPHVAEA